MGRTRSECALLREEIEEWFDRRTSADSFKQYFTQLEALRHLFMETLKELSDAVGSQTQAKNAAEIYIWCRKIDKRLVWLRKFWLYYKVKFDQRDIEPSSSVLRAADELVWSCYAPAFQKTGTQPPTAPLPYFEPLYSAEMIPRVDPPREFASPRIVDSEFLKKVLSELPIPVIALPTICAKSPWWLVYLAHEVGHSIQSDLLQGQVLEESFQAELKRLSVNVGADDKEAAQWSDWHREIFADLYSVCCIGPAAPPSIAELEFSSDDAMLTPKTLYPPPIVRLTLLSAAANRGESLPSSLPEAVRELQQCLLSDKEQPDPLRKSAAALLRRIDSMAEVPEKSKFATVGSLRSFSGWDAADFRPGGTIYEFQRTLLDKKVIKHSSGPRTARLIIAAGYRAWSHLATSDAEDAEIEDSLSALRDDLLKSIQENRPTTTRAGGAGRATAFPDGAKLGRTLLELRDEELFADEEEDLRN